jgi:hypothetical protein
MRWFAELTQKELKRGVHRSVQALEWTAPGSVEALCVDSSRRLGLMLSVIVGLVFVGRDVSDGGVEPLVVEPVDPFRGGEFDVGEAVPGLAGLDQFRLVEADLGLHECVVQGVTDRSDGRVDAGVEQVGGEGEGRD